MCGILFLHIVWGTNIKLSATVLLVSTVLTEQNVWFIYAGLLSVLTRCTWLFSHSLNKHPWVDLRLHMSPRCEWESLCVLWWTADLSGLYPQPSPRVFWSLGDTSGYEAGKIRAGWPDGDQLQLWEAHFNEMKRIVSCALQLRSASRWPERVNQIR